MVRETPVAGASVVLLNLFKNYYGLIVHMLKFAKEFILSPRNTGAIAPSSTELATTITRIANLAMAKSVVEFGSGTGVFTERILQSIGQDTNFFALEINPFFVKKTKQRCPSATVYQDSAYNVKKYLQDHGLKHCDCIVSGLPWTLFDEAEQDRMLKVIADSLSPNGTFVSFAYLGGNLSPGGRRFRKFLLEHFSAISKSRMVWNNLPPAFVYSCTK